MTIAMYTIGYATKPIELYIQQLKNQRIDVVADIRSVPFSNAFFDYHQDALKKHLREASITYVYLGKELGPRSKDPAHYNTNNQVQFDLLMSSDLFNAGIRRLFEGIQKGFSIALSCAEKDPAICHRSLLVGWALLHKHQIELRHIRHDGALETQSNLEQRLTLLTNTYPDMLSTEQETLERAYAQQCQDYAYKQPQSKTS